VGIPFKGEREPEEIRVVNLPMPMLAPVPVPAHHSKRRRPSSVGPTCRSGLDTSLQVL